MLSTSIMVAGLEKGSELWKKSQDFGVIFITEEKEIYITEDISDLFTLDEDTAYKVSVIKK